MKSQQWYQSIRKPDWAPDPSVFGRAWTPLYAIIAVVNLLVLRAFITGKVPLKRALPFWVNLAANLAFTPIQFGLRNNALALLDIIIVLASIVWCMAAIWRHNRWLAIAYIPYLIWVCIATLLQIQILALN